MVVVSDQLPSSKELAKSELVIFEDEDIDIGVFTGNVTKPRVDRPSTTKSPAVWEFGHEPGNPGDIRVEVAVFKIRNEQRTCS